MADRSLWKTYALFVLGAACAAAGICVVVDLGLNGLVSGWFEKTFYTRLNARTVYPDGAVYSEYTTIVRWEILKSFLYQIAVVLAVVWTASVLAADYLSRRRCARKLQEMEEALRRQESQLQAQSSQKNDLIAYLAHDLKTPLTSVVGYLSLLDEVPDMPPVQKGRYIHVALDKALRLEKLINELFEITRYNLHQVVLETQTIDLTYLLSQLADEFYPLLKSHGNTVSLEAEPEVLITADPDKLARVFNNLLKNAVSYSHPNTPIFIRVTREEGFVTIAFTNTGRTIPGYKLEAIFDKFYRLDDARSGNTGGAGLGLSIARQIVQAHGGVIEAESAREQTTFTVRLPLSPYREEGKSS